MALESGVRESALVDAWVQGGPGEWDELARDGFTFRTGDAAKMRSLVHGLREHLAVNAPEAVALVDAALDATAPYASANNGAAPQRTGPAKPAATGQPPRS